MKRIVDSDTLERSASGAGINRERMNSQEDELASILSEIHAKYSGSLAAFFEDLGKRSERISPLLKRKLVGAK